MTLTPHSIINGDACFAYFNKIWGIPKGYGATRSIGRPKEKSYLLLA